jgi:hypothetical protein
MCGVTIYLVKLGETPVELFLAETGDSRVASSGAIPMALARRRYSGAASSGTRPSTSDSSA